MARRQSSGLILWLLLGVIALIGYGSLYPFDFRFDASHPTFKAALLQLTWARAGRADQVRNVLLYLPFGFCVMLWLRVRSGAIWAAIIATLLGSLLSLSIEILQVYLTIRVPSLRDIVLNAAGTSVGALAGIIWRGLSGLVYMSPNSRNRPGDRSALLLICTWVLWRLAEFDPGVSLSRLKLALRPFMEVSYSLPLIVKYLLFWLVIAQAVLSFANRQRSNEALLTVIMVVMIGRLLFVTQPFIVSELLALLLLLPALVVLHKLRGTPQTMLMTLAFVAWLVYESLSPFVFIGIDHQFDLWPFLGWFEQGMPIDPDQLLRKLFIFGAFTWLLKENGLSMRSAMIAVVATVFSLEIVQLWQAGHTSSLTDPAIALVMGSLMRLSGNDRASRSNSLKRS